MTQGNGMPAPALALRIVSLSDAAARRARIAADLAKFPLPWAFADACRADTPADAEPDAAAQMGRFGRRLSPGEVGCFKSHLTVLSAFDDDPSLDWLLVIEDDVWLDPDLDYPALAAEAEAAGIGLLRLFTRTWVPGCPVGRFGPRQLLYLSTEPYGTQAYLISRDAAARFRAHVRAIVRPVDDELGRFWEHGLEIFALFPSPAVEREGPSTLEAAREGALAARPPRSASRWRSKIGDAAAKRIWLTRRRLGLVGDGLWGVRRPRIYPLPPSAPGTAASRG